MKNLKILVGLLIIGSLVGVGVLVFRTMNTQIEKPNPAKELPAAADLKLDRVHYTETHDGVKEWEVEADSALYYKDENTVMLNNVKATFFGKNKETYTLVAAKGKLHTQSKIIEVFDGVELSSSDGYHLITRTLTYQSEKREIRTADAVQMNGPQVRVDGIGLVVEIDRQRMKILQQVTTTLDQWAMKKYVRSDM
jgi:LPS export ABC transporter protein LptC